MKTAVTYNRFSPGPNQREESITGQLRENHRLADLKGLTVIHDYIDRSISGRTDDRPAFLQMIKDAEKGMFKYVICYQTGRFARDRYDAAVYKRKLKKMGVQVLYSKMNIPDGPEGIILESVLEGLDEYYSLELSQKIRRGQYDNALQGKASGGIVPYGLILDKDKKYIIDEEKSSLVREVFNRYIAGENVIDICRDFNERGIRTATGGLFNKNSLHRMLKQRKYIGYMHYEDSEDETKKVDLEDAIPAIITKEVFEKAQMRIESNKRRTSPKRPLDIPFFLSGKVFDGICGGALVGDSGTSKTGNTYYYYTCQNKKQKKSCKTKSVRKEWLEDLVVNATRECVLTDEMIEKVSEWIIELQKENSDEDTTLKVMQKELQQVQSSLKNIIKAIEQGIITDTTKDRLVELEERQAILEKQIKIEELKINAPKITKEHIIYWLEKFKEQEADKEIYKQQVIDTFVNAVILWEDVVTIAYNYQGENDIVDVDIKNLKDTSRNSVRMCLINWRIGDSNS